MAITTRSERFGQNYLHLETDAHVGPGTYQLLNDYQQYTEGAAPFGSSNMKDRVFGSKSETPGPGQYTLDTGQHVRAPQSVFISNVERFTAPITRTPGPGEYDTRPKWIPSKTQPEKTKRLLAAPLGSEMHLQFENDTCSIVFGPSECRPTIPVQSRTLKTDSLMPPPPKVPRGPSIGKSLPRPGLFQQAEEDPESNMDLILGMSSSRKRPFGGAETVVSFNPERVDKPTSVFASTSKRFKEPQTQAPGPMSYSPKTNTIEDSVRKIARRKRSTTVPTNASRRTKLGDRASYVPEWLLETPPATRYNIPDNEQGPREHYDGYGNLIRGISVPFNSTAQRDLFLGYQSDAPGPGNYTTPAKLRKAGLSAAFRSAPRPDIVSEEKADTPGPGSYRLSSSAMDYYSRQPSRSFRTPIGPYVRRRAEEEKVLFCLGPEDTGPFMGRHADAPQREPRESAVFKSRTKRFTHFGGNTEMANIGPDKYTIPPVTTPGGLILPDKHVSTRARRNTCEQLPGPGEYTLPDNLIRKSYSKLFT